MKLQARALAIILLLIAVLSVSASYATAATASDFASTNSAITSAFVATQNAQTKGGNVTALVQELNLALALVQKAENENYSNPARSIIDLQNATNIANLVSSQSSGIAVKGAASLQVRNEESIASAVVVALMASLIYIYGERIYRRIWLFVYRNYVVKPVNG